MKLLTCIIKYLFTEIKCTETMIAFAQGQVVFQLEPEKKLFPGSLIQWYSCDLAIHILCSPYKKKSLTEKTKKNGLFYLLFLSFLPHKYYAMRWGRLSITLVLCFTAA